MLKLTRAIGERFSNKKVVIVGDLVADQFLRGTISRRSREAPVFILRHDETETLAGGAANAAVNIASLGGNAVLIGVVGNDLNGKTLLEKLHGSKVNYDYVLTSDKMQTTTKVRILAGKQKIPYQQVIRIDYENSKTFEDKLYDKLKENLLLSADQADAIILSDYSYGVTERGIAETAYNIASEKNIPLLVDSRFNLQKFPNATTATPNRDEVEQILGRNFTETECIKLCESLGYQSLLITCGNEGMILIEKNGVKRFEAVGDKKPADVTGAGDTVIAAYALGLASGLSFADAANVANHAGGIVVMKKGTASVTTDELVYSLENYQKPNQKAQAL